MVCSRLSCSSLSWRFCSGLRDRSIFLRSLLINYRRFVFSEDDPWNPQVILAESPLKQVLDFKSVNRQPRSIRFSVHSCEGHANCSEKFLVVEWLREKCGRACTHRRRANERVFFSSKDHD